MASSEEEEEYENEDAHSQPTAEEGIAATIGDGTQDKLEYIEDGQSR